MWTFIWTDSRVLFRFLLVYYAHKEWYGDGFGKACFSWGEKKIFFIWRKQKKKKLAMRKPKKKKEGAGGVAYVRTFFIFLVSKLDNKTNKKESTKFSFTPHLFLSPSDVDYR